MPRAERTEPVAPRLGIGSVSGLNIGSIIVAVIGALILLAGWRVLKARA